MENYSPLNQGILRPEASYDIEADHFKWLDLARGAHQGKNKFPDKKTDPHGVKKLKWELCGSPKKRRENMLEFYRKMEGKNMLRARVAWAIGHSFLYHERDFRIAEKLFFETIYMISDLDSDECFPQKHAILTELAALALVDYADVLLENGKYTYSIAALERAILCLKIR